MPRVLGEGGLWSWVDAPSTTTGVRETAFDPGADGALPHLVHRATRHKMTMRREGHRQHATINRGTDECVW